MSYKRIDFTKLGGFPLTQDTLAFMQAAYLENIEGVAKRMGNGIIISGMVDNGTSVSTGWIIYDNELLPFVGGNKQTYFIIEETDAQAQFEDDSVKTVYFTRQARFGSGAGQVAYSSLKRLETALKVQEDLTALQAQVEALDGFVPSGLISMWSGAIDAIPAGWALCDGTQGTPNLKGKFIVGYDPDDFDYNAIGSGGGNKEQTITQPNLPAIKLDVPIPVSDTSQKDTGYGRIVTGSDIVEPGAGPTLQTETLGLGSPLENRPPYYTLAYIMKL